MLLEVAGVVAQHRFDSAFFVVRWDEQQQARLRHAEQLPENTEKATAAAFDRRFRITPLQPTTVPRAEGVN
jgi:hypothetical protein